MEKNKSIKIRLTKEEKERLVELAKAHGLSLSEYLRRVGLGQEITSRKEIEIVLELARVNADQARLGNLLKLAINMENDHEIDRIIVSIRQTQQLIKETVERI